MDMCEKCKEVTKGNEVYTFFLLLLHYVYDRTATIEIRSSKKIFYIKDIFNLITHMYTYICMCDKAYMCMYICIAQSYSVKTAIKMRF